ELTAVGVILWDEPNEVVAFEGLHDDAFHAPHLGARRSAAHGATSALSEIRITARGAREGGRARIKLRSQRAVSSSPHAGDASERDCQNFRQLIPRAPLARRDRPNPAESRAKLAKRGSVVIGSVEWGLTGRSCSSYKR